MNSYMTISLAVLPFLLAHGLSPSQNIPSAKSPYPNEDHGAPAQVLPPPVQVAFQVAHGPSTEAPRDDATGISPRDTYPRPTVSWLSSLPRRLLGSVPYGEVIEHCTEPDTMALTFDDGPWEYTSDLLDLLEENGANATFFVCGGNMDGDGQLTGHGHPQLLRRMIRGGHQVGTHTWGHADLATLDEDAILDQVLQNEQALVETLGMIPTYLRPPYFSTDWAALEVVRGLGYHVINADVDTRDWVGDYDAARANFDEGVRQGGWRGDTAGGMIVLAHNIRERTVHELAEYMIEQAVENGYRLVTVGDCLGDPERNWYRNPSTGGSWLSRGHDSGRHKVGRAVVPPPDAPKEESWESGLDAALSHKLHLHTLPPPDVMEHTHQSLIARAEEELSNGPISIPTTAAAAAISRHTRTIGELPAYKTVTGPAGLPHPITPTPGPTGTNTHHPHPKGLFSAARVEMMTTITIPFPFEGGQLPPKGFRMKPTKIAARSVGQEHEHEQEQGQGEEQNQIVQRQQQQEEAGQQGQHHQEQEQEQIQEQDRDWEHSKTINATATGKPAAAEGACASRVDWGLVALAVTSYILFR